MSAALEARELTVRLNGRTVVNSVSLSVEEGSMVGLLGANGAGKTTLLRAIGGLLPATAGTVLVGGRPLRRLPRRARARMLAYVPQGQVIHWPLTVECLVALGRLPHLTTWGRPTATDQVVIRRVMAETDTTSFSERPVTTLSSGERARVLLARALAAEAPILLADEPAAALDPYHQLRVMELLRGHARAGRSVLIILHDLTLAARFCDQVALMRDGRVVAMGAPREALSAANLASAFQVTSRQGVSEGEFFVLPWRRLDPEELAG